MLAEDVGYFSPGSVLSAQGTTARSLTVARSRPFRGTGLIVAFEDVTSREAAALLRGAVLTVPAGRLRPLEPGEFWPEELVGLQAVDASGRLLGDVTGVEFGSQDRLVVTTSGGAEVLVPFVADLVGDPEGGQIRIDPPVGLFDLDAPDPPD